MFYLISFMLGGAMGVMAIALTSAGGEQDAYMDGYHDGYREAREEHLTAMEGMLTRRNEQ